MEEIKQVGICFQGLYGVPVIQTQCFSPNVESPPEKWRCFLIMSHCEVQGSEIVEVGPQIGTVGRQTLFVVANCPPQSEFSGGKVFHVLVAYR